MAFKDHFSGHASEYARARPRYPGALFEHLAALAPGREQAWDCGTGSGQAACGLARHFERVVATDASEQQISNAAGPVNVRFLVAAADAVPLPPGSVDLIAVAQALHWFDLAAFYAEVRRVGRPGAVLAAWCYDRLRVVAVEDAVERLYADVLGPYWPAERALVEAGYRTLPFPFDELPAPAFEMVHAWTLAQLVQYLETWSAARRYAEAEGRSALEPIRAELVRGWGPPERTREIRWPVYLRVGRVRGRPGAPREAPTTGS